MRMLAGRFAVLALLLGLPLVLGTAPSPARATGPCDDASGLPGPPVGPMDPAIAGTVVAQGVGPVSGATVRLFVCDAESQALEIAEATTTAQGAYAFPGLEGPAWYFVSVDLSGPLSGLQAASGTRNPSALIGVGEGLAELEMAFE